MTILVFHNIQVHCGILYTKASFVGVLSFTAFNGSQLHRLDLSLPPGFEVAWTPDGRKYYIEYALSNFSFIVRR